MSKSRIFAGAAAAAALGLSLAGAASAAGPQLPGNGPVIANGLPDLTVGGGYIDGKDWTKGGVVVLDDMGFVLATKVGPKKNMCRFKQMDYQPGNKGTADAAGPSQSKVYRNGAIVNVDNFAGGYFAAGQWRPFETWQAELVEGKNSVKVVMDVNKQVAESNESNTFGSTIMVNLDCDGDGKINGKPIRKTLKPGKRDPKPAVGLQLYIQPAN